MGELIMKITKFEERLKTVQETASASFGEIKILQAYNRTKETTDSDTLVIFDSFFPSELHEMSLALKELEVEKVIITCKSTSLMETLQHFISEGWAVSGSAEVQTVTGFKSTLKGLMLSL